MRECVIVIVGSGVLKQPLIGIKQSHRGRLQASNDIPSGIASPLYQDEAIWWRGMRLPHFAYDDSLGF